MAAPAEPSAKPASSLTLRLISAAVLIPIVALAAYAGKPAWDFLVIAFAAVMIGEWCQMAGRRRDPAHPGMRLPAPHPAPETMVAVGLIVEGLVIFSREGYGWINPWAELAFGVVVTTLFAALRHRAAALWFGLGILYVAVPCAAIITLRADPEIGLAQILWIVVLVIAVDTGAYFAGRSIGGPKLAPAISPKKTWAGLIGGLVAAAIVGAATAALLGRPSPWPLALLSAGLAVVEQAGDLAESAFKRHFGVKDASHIIPGHGGAMDRVDGLVAVAVVVAGINYWTGSSVLTWL